MAIPFHTPAAKAQKQNVADRIAVVSNPSDPVADLGRQYVVLTEAHDRAERKLWAAKKDQNPTGLGALEIALQATKDAREAVVKMAPTLAATTPAGAMFHVMLASSAAFSLHSYTDDKEKAAADEQYRIIGRALYSALAVLSEVSGINPAEVGGDYFMPPAINPHALMAEA